MRRLLFLLFLARVASADAASSIDEYFTRLAAHGFSGAVLVAWDEHPDLTRAEFIRWVVTERNLLSPPGKAWSYASFDYWLLEEVIERASGMPFEEFLNRELFAPAGMRFTGFAIPKWDRDNVARSVRVLLSRARKRFVELMDR